MKTNDCEILKINFLKVTTDDDFELRASFYRFCDVLESIRLQTFSSVKNKIKPIKIKDCVIVKTCSDIFYTIGQKKCPMPSAKIRNYSHSHNLVSQ